MKDNAANIIVIGGSIIDSSIAFRLAEKGQKVILLEKRRVGEEASTRNADGVRQQDRDPAKLPLALEAIKISADVKVGSFFFPPRKRGPPKRYFCQVRCL